MELWPSHAGMVASGQGGAGGGRRRTSAEQEREASLFLLTRRWSRRFSPCNRADLFRPELWPGGTCGRAGVFRPELWPHTRRLPRMLRQINISTMETNTIIFIDFEASSLSSESWPIEIGLSWIEGGAVRTWSSLIRPRASWLSSGWSSASAQVHGIPREELDNAPGADSVARSAIDLVGGRNLLCDAPEFDGHWLSRLMAGQGAEHLKLMEFGEVAAKAFDDATLDWVYEGLERRHVPHRAGPDSARLAGAWNDGLKRLAG